MKAIILEIKKILDKYFILLFIVLVIVNITNIVIQYNQFHDVIYMNGYIKVYEEIKGLITLDKIQFVSEQYAYYSQLVENGEYQFDKMDADTYSGYVFGDMNIFEQLYNQIYECVQYQENIKTKIDILNENNAKALDDKLIYKNNYIIAKISNRKINNFYNTEGIEQLLTYDTSVVFIFIISIFTTIRLYCIENKSSMKYLIHNIANGYAVLQKNKIIALTLIIFSLTFIFQFIDLIVFSQICIIDGLVNPLYSIPYFYHTSLNSSILLFWFIQGLLKALFIIFIAFIVHIIMMLFKKIEKISSLFFLVFTTAALYIISTFPKIQFLLQPRQLFSTFYIMCIGNICIEEYWLKIGIIFILTMMYIVFWCLRGKVYDKYL